MWYRGVVVSLILVVAVLSVPAHASLDWMTRPGTVGHALALEDGSSVCLDAVIVSKIRAAAQPSYFAIHECFMSRDRLVVLSPPSESLRLGQTIDIEGIITTLPNGCRAIMGATIHGYTDKQGNLLRHGPLIKGLLKPTPWEWKVDLTVHPETQQSGSIPYTSSEPNTTPLKAPTFYQRISDATGCIRILVNGDFIQLAEFQCKPIISTGIDQNYGNYFIMGEDSGTDTLKVYCQTEVGVTDRVNAVTGQLREENSGQVLCVDSGPGYDPQIFEGASQTATEGTIGWAKTLPDTTILSAPLAGKIVSRTFPSLGYFYVQEPLWSSGIRVNDSGMASLLATGDTVDVSGEMSTDDGERVVNASSTTLVGSTIITSVGMNNRSLAGGNLNALTPGAYGAYGLNNVGLLVRAWGKVTSVGSDYFYINDGSNCDDGSGVGGVRVVNVTGYVPGVDDYVAVTGVSGLATYNTDLARTIRFSRSDDLSSVYPPLPPSNLIAASTGSGEITLYWDGVPGATGYNVYRGTISGGQNYSNPLNGSTPVNQTSYSGGSVYWYTDAGLTDGQEYFYTVKAVAGSSESRASNEDSDVPNAAAIPWDSTNPGNVLSAFRTAFGDDPPEGSLRVAGPDGRIYEDGQSSVLPPDGEWIPDTNQFRLTDTTVVTLPDDGGEFEEFSGSPGIAPMIPATTLKQHKGPYRRVRTVQSYRGAKGQVFVPLETGNIHIRQDLSDFAYIYLGSSSQCNAQGDCAKEVDAGIQWSPVTHSWAAFMLMNGRVVSSNPDIPKRIKPIVNLPQNEPRMQTGQFILMTYDAKNPYPSAKKKVALLKVEGLDDGIRRSLGAYTLHSAQENVRAKRAHSIAGPRFGIQHTGSYIKNVAWAQGQVITTSGTPTAWSNGITNENGSNPAKGAIINWNETSPYVAEDNIRIILPSQ